MENGTGTYAGMNPVGTGVIPLDLIIVSLGSSTFSCKLVSMGSNSDLRERSNDGCELALPGCEFSEGGSNTCSSGTEGGSEAWYIIRKQSKAEKQRKRMA